MISELRHFSMPRRARRRKQDHVKAHAIELSDPIHGRVVLDVQTIRKLLAFMNENTNKARPVVLLNHGGHVEYDDDPPPPYDEKDA